MEKNYIEKNLFNASAYNKLIEATAENEMFIKVVKESTSDFVEYVKAVDMGEMRIKIAYATEEGYDLRQTIEAIDNSRRVHHNSAIVSVKLLNRLCEAEKIENIFTGNIDDRLEVADFCLEIVNYLFENRKL